MESVCEFAGHAEQVALPFASFLYRPAAHGAGGHPLALRWARAAVGTEGTGAPVEVRTRGTLRALPELRVEISLVAGARIEGVGCLWAVRVVGAPHTGATDAVLVGARRAGEAARARQVIPPYAGAVELRGCALSLGGHERGAGQAQLRVQDVAVVPDRALYAGPVDALVPQ
eukprot:234619-Hanusia_phi.AAC.2